jgi:carbon monoxide dehydrogenase subunit G
MGKTYRIVAGLVIVVIVAAGGWWIYQRFHAGPTGIISESVTKHGDVWSVDVKARVPASEKAVFDALQHPERAHLVGVSSVNVVSDQGNEKVLAIILQAPGGASMPARVTYHYYPDQDRITSVTGDNPFISGTAEYRLSPEGGNTVIVTHQDLKVLIQVPVPDALIRGRIRQFALAQLDSLREQLHLPPPNQTSSYDEEP